MPVKNAIAKNWASWVRGSDGYLRSDDPNGTYGNYTPTLPQATVDTTYSLPTGNTWTATNTSSGSVAGTGTGNRTDCSLNYALTNCALNDIIVLTAGATYTGTYTIPNKVSGSGWVYVISSALASLPTAGTRVAPANAANMPLMVAPTANLSTIISTASSHHFRFVGIEIKSASTNASPLQAGVVVLDNADTSNSTVCNNIIIDRCYIHGSAATTQSGRRGVHMSGTNLAVIDSYVSGFFDDGYDSQAVWIYQGDGPFKIDNNYLEAASENFMTGGSDPAITNSVPQDITITRNYFFKPLGWIGVHPMKNLIEFKNAQRVLVRGNVFENCPASAQQGFAFVLTPRNQSNTAPWCVTKDITVQLNKFINCGQGYNIAGDDDNFSSQRTVRVLIENNLFGITGLNSADGKIGQITRGPQYVTIRHNTGFTTGAAMCFSENISAVADRFKYQDNIFSAGTYGFAGTGEAEGNAVLAAYYTNYTLSYNAIIGSASTGTYPANNFFPANTGAVGFTNYAGGDYSLTGASPYHNAASDGTDIGCDIAALNTAIAGVV